MILTHDSLYRRCGKQVLLVLKGIVTLMTQTVRSQITQCENKRVGKEEST